MISIAQQARANLEQARELRAVGRTYRQIRRQLGLTSSQICRIRRTLKREKAALTRLRLARPKATPRELTVGACDLPPALRRLLAAADFKTLGDVADRMADPELPRLETMPGIGPARATMIRAMLERLALLEGPPDLRAEVEAIFPELRHT